MVEIKNWILSKTELTASLAVIEIGTIFDYVEPSDISLIEIKYPFGVYFLIYCVFKIGLNDFIFQIQEN